MCHFWAQSNETANDGYCGMNASISCGSWVLLVIRTRATTFPKFKNPQQCPSIPLYSSTPNSADPRLRFLLPVIIFHYSHLFKLYSKVASLPLSIPSSNSFSSFHMPADSTLSSTSSLKWSRTKSKVTPKVTQFSHGRS